ncbi:MAG: 50S ribosomal protein L22 [Elusimicrobia bacterium]|nr:50S ribosomal protein L22 [Elusimicrobiota bacterium]
MEARAIARFVRYAPRKVNQVLTVIRNQRVDKAFEILSFLPKNATELVEKVLKSAVANAGKLKDLSSIKIKEAWVGQGPTLKRMRPGPMGRGLGYKRKTSHLTIIVTDEGVVPAKRKKKAVVKAPVAAEATEEKAPAKKARKTVKKTVKKAEKETAEK